MIQFSFQFQLQIRHFAHIFLDSSQLPCDPLGVLDAKDFHIRKHQGGQDVGIFVNEVQFDHLIGRGDELVVQRLRGEGVQRGAQLVQLSVQVLYKGLDLCGL